MGATTATYHRVARFHHFPLIGLQLVNFKLIPSAFKIFHDCNAYFWYISIAFLIPRRWHGSISCCCRKPYMAVGYSFNLDLTLLAQGLTVVSARAHRPFQRWHKLASHVTSAEGKLSRKNWVSCLLSTSKLARAVWVSNIWQNSENGALLTKRSIFRFHHEGVVSRDCAGGLNTVKSTLVVITSNPQMYQPPSSFLSLDHLWPPKRPQVSPFSQGNPITTFPKENPSISPSSKKKSIIKETGYCPPNAVVGGSRSICEASVRLIHLSAKCRKFQALQGNQRPNDRAGREPVPYEEMMEPCGEWNVD